MWLGSANQSTRGRWFRRPTNQTTYCVREPGLLPSVEQQGAHKVYYITSEREYRDLGNIAGPFFSSQPNAGQRTAQQLMDGR